MENLTSVMHPHDPSYQARRKQIVKDLSRMDAKELKQAIRTQADFGAIRDDQNLSGQIMQESLAASQGVQGSFITKNPGNFLDTGGNAFTGTGTTTQGGVLVRQDLEAPAYALFLKQFPLFDALTHGPANGLVHTAMQITAAEHAYTQGSYPTSLITEVGTVGYVNGDYARATFPIAIFAQGRGVGLKELAAVQAGGVNYDPMGMEMSNAMIRLAQDVQTIMFQGNATNAAGTAAQEAGFYDTKAFDGLRGVLGSQGSFSTNGAVQIDQGALNISEAMQTGAAKIANVGGNPTLGVMSMNSKQALDIEQQGANRYSSPSVVAGVTVSSVPWANGNLSILPVPGSTMGTYNRVSDNALVEDIYLLDDTGMMVRYLYSDGFTVLQIPTGVDGYLSMRYLIFGMFGLEIAAPLYNGKVRRLV